MVIASFFGKRQLGKRQQRRRHPRMNPTDPGGCATGPALEHAAAYDPVHNRMIIYGGANLSSKFSDL
jgi:hypothetical protein